MQSATADDFALVLHDHEVADVLADFGEGASQEGSISYVNLDELLDRNCVGQCSVTRKHGRLLHTSRVFPSSSSTPPEPAWERSPPVRRGWPILAAIAMHHRTAEQPRFHSSPSPLLINAPVRSPSLRTIEPPCRSSRARGGMALHCGPDTPRLPARS